MTHYPGDVSVLSPLYLNLVTLAPGEALFLPAGELHAYLEGTALEIMANSDNVLRGGLTPKHVDVPELLATLAFEGHGPEVLEPVDSGPGERVYRTPAREFELGLLEVTAEAPVHPEPGARRRDPARPRRERRSCSPAARRPPWARAARSSSPPPSTRTPSRATAASAAPASRPRASSLPAPQPRPGTRPPWRPSTSSRPAPACTCPDAAPRGPSRRGSARPPSSSRPSPRGAAG